MNILPKKNWHVRNKDNIEKVRKDEAKAAAEQKEKEKRLAIAESEARINVLRSRAGASIAIDKARADHTDRFNLFEQEEQGRFNEEKNPETEAEKNLEKEKFEKKIGLLKYLNEDQLDLKSKPWYQTVKRNSLNDDEDTKSSEVDLKRKLQLDPINMMKDQLPDKDKSKKDKSKEPINKKKKVESANTTESKSSKTIEQLRAERLKRETEERMKVEKLLNGNKEAKQIVEMDDRKRKYNSQFNPNIAKY